MRITISGPPGSGKTTACANLSERLGLKAVVFGKIFRNFALRLLSVAFGAIIYYIVVQAVITLGFDANLLKLLNVSAPVTM